MTFRQKHGGGRFGKKNLPKRLDFFAETSFPKRPVPGPSSKRIGEERRSHDRKGEYDDDEIEIPNHVG